MLKFTPLYEANDVEDERRLRARYIPLLMPARDKVSLIHLAIVSFEHCLYGGTVVMKNPSSADFYSRNLRYYVIFVTGHRLGLKEMILRSGVVGDNVVEFMSDILSLLSSKEYY